MGSELETRESVPRRLEDVPGWFSRLDQRVFSHFLGQSSVLTRGGIVELGAYLGKSAIHLGGYVRTDEQFVVCDLFEDPETDGANLEENAGSYHSLTRAAFERNYLAFHDSLPTVVQGLSSSILEYVPPGSARFVHVDASHLYEHVAEDISAARTMLAHDGIVCFDDYRSRHTPGVAAAVWEAVVAGDLVPVCLTTQKFYGVFGADPEAHHQRVEEMAQSDEALTVKRQRIKDFNILRVLWRQAAPAPVTRPLEKRLADLEREVSHAHQKLDGISQQIRDASFAARVYRKLRRP